MTYDDGMSQENPEIYVGMPVNELPRPHVPSTTRACEGCGAMVWVDKRTVRLAMERSILCTNCAVLLLETEGQISH